MSTAENVKYCKTNVQLHDSGFQNASGREFNIFIYILSDNVKHQEHLQHCIIPQINQRLIAVASRPSL